MHTIELTKGHGWEAPVMHYIMLSAPTSLPELEQYARDRLSTARQHSTDSSAVPDGYRIKDERGRRLKATEG
jgi:hypothetical protein